MEPLSISSTISGFAAQIADHHGSQRVQNSTVRILPIAPISRCALIKKRKFLTDDDIISKLTVMESIPVSEKGTLIIPESYNFKHKRRGKCLIINNRYFLRSTGQSDRDGTDLDAAICEAVFERLGFEVERNDNLNGMEMRMKFREVASEDHSDADCFACVILSHGREGQVYATDTTVQIDFITGLFKGEQCRSLRGKPKLFFIQACRGTKVDRGVMVAEDTTDAAGVGPANLSIRKIPAEADVMIAYSVVPGYYSWRNSEDGSWFIQGLSYVFLEHGKTMELMQMMTIINKIVAYDFASCTDEEWLNESKQVPCVVSMLTKQVFFHPKE